MSGARANTWRLRCPEGNSVTITRRMTKTPTYRCDGPTFDAEFNERRDAKEGTA